MGDDAVRGEFKMKNSKLKDRELRGQPSVPHFEFLIFN
jgi:hypothetical protein